MSNSKERRPEEKLSHSMAHYLLAIHKLKEEKGYARVTDIAKDLSLTKGSVSTAINNLKKKFWVKEEDDSKFLNLTEQGHKEVHNILSSRTLLFYFLRDILGVSEDVANNDACLMEHLMSDETRTKFFAFMKNVTCGCEEMKDKKDQLPEYLQFETSLHLCDFDSAGEFIGSQVGGAQLPPDHDLHK